MTHRRRGRKSARSVAWSFGLAWAVAFVVACAPSIKRPASPTLDETISRMWAKEMRARLRHGDWVLARSYSKVGKVIVLATPGADLSHSAIWDAERGVLIEAVRPVVRENTLEPFIARNHYMYIVRPAYRDDADRAASVARARSMIGAKYDIPGLLGLPSSDKMYCSGLVFWASDMRSRQVRKHTVITPAELFELGEQIYFTGTRDSTEVAQDAVRGASTTVH